MSVINNQRSALRTAVQGMMEESFPDVDSYDITTIVNHMDFDWFINGTKTKFEEEIEGMSE